MIYKSFCEVLISNEQYSSLTDEYELKLDEADKAAADSSDKRLTEDEVFRSARGRMLGREAK